MIGGAAADIGRGLFLLPDTPWKSRVHEPDVFFLGYRRAGVGATANPWSCTRQ